MDLLNWTELIFLVLESVADNYAVETICFYKSYLLGLLSVSVRFILCLSLELWKDILFRKVHDV